MGKELDKALAKVRKKNPHMMIGSLADVAFDLEKFTTGNVVMDHILGVGGVPKGRLLELYGPPSCGKTTLALQIAAQVQREGGVVLYADFEQAMDESYANALGVDTKNPDHFLFVQPDTLEEGMQVIRDLNSSGEIGLVLFDSVAAMTPEKMFANEVGKSTFALKAKLMSDALKVLKTEFYRTGCIGIFLNHIQDVIDSSPMGQKLSSQGIKRTTTPGGKALKYYASIRVEFKPVGSIRGKVHNDLTGETEDMVVSQKVEAYVIKNKVAPPFKKGELRVNFGRGFSQAHAAMVVLTGRGLIKKEAAGIYRFNEQTQPPWMNIAEDPKSNWIKGEAALIEQIESSPEWQDKLMALATEALAAEAPKKVAAPPVEDEGPTPEELDALLEEEPV